MYEIQRNIEDKYSKRNIAKAIYEDIDPNSDVIHEMIDKINNYRCSEYSYESKNNRIAGINISSQEIAIQITAAVIPLTEISPVQGVCGKLAPIFEYKNILDGVKTAAELLAVCEGKLFTLYHADDYRNPTETLGIESNFECSTHVKEFINQTKYLPPMLVQPNPWKDNNTGGNLSGSGSVILKRINYNNEEQCLNVLNTLQEIPWTINENILEFMEVSKKPLDTVLKKKSFKYLKETSEEVFNELIALGNKFYFVWKRDSRGRSYSQGYHVNLQGNSYRKALVEFHDKTLITNEVIT